MMTPFLMAATLVAASLASALAALLILSGFTRGPRGARLASAEAAVEPAVFLFDDRDLVDATPPARRLLEMIGGSGSEWDRLASYLSQKIPDCVAALSTLAETGEIDLRAPGDANFRIHAEYLRGIARLTLTDLSSEGQGVLVDALSFHAQEEELATLRETLGALPYPVWRTGRSGEVQRVNRSYLALAADLTGGDDLVWPLPALFEMPAGNAGTGLPKRLSLAAAGKRPAQWYDCHSLASGDGTLHFAVLADPIVKAETALRDFVQTLTKTFAHLPIGLAIFDRQRQLALFNPALMELTSLTGEYLSGRPTLFSFLDQLREARIIPEPKDYSAWREKMMNLEKAASLGQYEEAWSLASGQTYRFTGRPHPDGAVAFFLEDITAEISLTRRFRSEIELGQSVIDAIEDAIAVFSPNADLVLANAAYGALWGIDPASTLGQMTIIDATRHWQALCRPTPVWGDLRDFVGDMNERAEWDASITMTDGCQLSARFLPMSGGATMVRFLRNGPEKPLVYRTRRPRRGDAAAPLLQLDV